MLTKEQIEEIRKEGYSRALWSHELDALCDMALALLDGKAGKMPEEPEIVKEWREHSPLSHQVILGYIDALRQFATARIAELEKDAARYRWLRERYYAADFNFNQSGESVICFKWPDGVSCGTTPNTLDTQIDAASKEQSRAGREEK